MTDYQMRAIFDLISTVAENMLKESPEKSAFIKKLDDIREGKEREKRQSVKP